MKTIRVIGASVLLLLLGAAAPTYARQDQHAKPPKREQKAKPERQRQAEPARQGQQAKPERQQQAEGKQEQQQRQQQTKSTRQEQQQEAKSRQERTKSHNQQQVKQVTATRQDQEQHARGQHGQQPEHAQGKWARNGQKDSRGHEYTESRFGPQHHARFEEHGGRYHNGRREYSDGGYWFYAGAYPAWFYQQDVYFTMGTDGLWYAVAYSDPSLIFQVYIE
ncbi:MAG TPA: hypothetical protein VN788_15250 [Verrucomicrobiae bacterium]|nr:hypothetical protein [Verrucomicrobiae bacterium]